MSISCPHRHLSYSQWRLTVYRALFVCGAATTTTSTTSRSTPIVRGYRSRSSRGSSSSRSGGGGRKSPGSKEWDPYSQEARSELQAVVRQLQQLQEGDGAQLGRSAQSAAQSAAQPAHPAETIAQSPVVGRALRRRKRQRPAKRQPTTREERALENDPWAAMLAQPVRMEIATRARLPTALMTDWALVKRPDAADEVYVLPDALADIDSLDKMGPEVVPFPPASTGPVMRLLASAKLMDRLTQMYTFVERPGSPSSPRIMRLSVDLTSLLPQLWRERIARVRHYDASGREVEAETGNKGGPKSPPSLEAGINKATLKWQPDIEHRLLTILRLRLAVCLKRVLHMVSDKPSSQVQLQPALLNLVDNHGRHQQQQQQQQQQQHSLEEKSHDWGPYSPPRILLYFSDDDRALQSLSNAGPGIPGIKPTTYTDESETAHEKVFNLLPPLLHTSTGHRGNNRDSVHRVPIFPLRTLLGAPQYAALVGDVHASTGHWLPWTGGSGRSGGEQRNILSVSADTPGANVLFSELWRLWRYVGGREAGS